MYLLDLKTAALAFALGLLVAITLGPAATVLQEETTQQAPSWAKVPKAHLHVGLGGTMLIRQAG